MKRRIGWTALVAVSVFTAWLLGQMLLIHAVREGNVGLARTLVIVGLSPDSKALFLRESPAEEAVDGDYYRDPDRKLRQLEIALVLLDHGADVHRRGTYMESLVFLAARFGATTSELLEASSRVLARIIERGGDVNQRTEDGYAPLCGVRHGGLAEQLLVAGARPATTCGPDGNSLVHHAAGEQNAIELIEIFTKAGVDPNARNNLGATPLFFAKTAATIDRLVELGADVNAKAKDGTTPLHAMLPDMRNSSIPWATEVVQSLLAHGARVDARDGKGRTPLDVAITNCKPSLAALMIPHDPAYAARLTKGASPHAVASAVILTKDPSCRDSLDETFDEAAPTTALPAKLAAPPRKGCTVDVHGSAVVEGKGMSLTVSQDASGVRAFTGTKAAMFLSCKDEQLYGAWYHVRVEGDDGTRIERLNLRVVEPGMGVHGLGAGGEVLELELPTAFKSGRWSWYVSKDEITTLEDAARAGHLREIQSLPLVVERPNL